MTELTDRELVDELVETFWSRVDVHEAQSGLPAVVVFDLELHALADQSPDICRTLLAALGVPINVQLRFWAQRRARPGTDTKEATR